MFEVEWSQWVPFAEALAAAPRLPGVYMAREGVSGEVVYIGMAGERRGGGKPQGIRGRLAIYASGKGIASGLGEAVFDRALADPEWLRARLVEVETSGPRRAKHWGVEAFRRADLHVRWATTTDRESAAALETHLVDAAGAAPWNKASVRVAKLGAPPTAGSMSAPEWDASPNPRRVPLPGAATTQRITAADLAKGQVRIPIAHKALLPALAQSLDLLLRGVRVTCRWNPRSDADKGRSGVLRVPLVELRSVVSAEDRLTISTDGDVLTLD